MSDLNALKTQLDQANSIIIAIPENPNKDIVAASLALFLSLKTTGKQVTPLSSSQPVVRDSHLVGLDKITTDVGGHNLVITVNLPEDAVDKVTSNVEGGHLNLIMNPKPGAPPLKQSDLLFSSSGATADLIIVLGANTLTDLGSLAEKESELFANQSKIVNLSNQEGNFGSLNLTDTSSSNSELVTAILQELKLPLDADIANNLMQGIEEATNNLASPQMTADTFEALAVLYRAGARRSAPAAPATAQIINNTPVVNHSAPIPTLKPSTPPPLKSSPSKPSSPEPDWLKPKIYKGGSSK